MTTCPECGIRYAADVTTCPWCGHIHARSSVAGGGTGAQPVDASPQSAAVSAPAPPQPPGGGAGDTPAGPVAAASGDQAEEEPSAGWVVDAPHPPAGDADGADEDLGWVAPVAPAAAGEPAGGVRPPPTSQPPPGKQDSVEQFALPEAPKPRAVAPPGMGPARTSVEDLRGIMAGQHQRPRWQSWIINMGIVALLIVAGALIAEFVPLPFISNSSGSTVAAPTTSPTAPTLPPTTQPGPASTAINRPTTTTSLSVPPPSVSVPPTVPFIEPIQPPVPVGDLLLGADGIGPFDFGQNGDTVIGRLVASLGQPDIDMGVLTATGNFGACPGDTIRVVRWGTLTIVNEVNETGGESFAEYRVDLSTGTEPVLKTLSEVAVGDTVGDLLDAYSSRFKVDFVDGPAYELRSNTSLLLWGPLTSTDSDGIVQGIYSPDICTTA